MGESAFSVAASAALNVANASTDPSAPNWPNNVDDYEVSEVIGLYTILQKSSFLRLTNSTELTNCFLFS